jgi:hypothetical protein
VKHRTADPRNQEPQQQQITQLMNMSILQTPMIFDHSIAGENHQKGSLSASMDLSFRRNVFDSDRLQRILCELDDDIYKKKRELHLLMNSSTNLSSLSALKGMRSDHKPIQVSDFFSILFSKFFLMNLQQSPFSFLNESRQSLLLSPNDKSRKTSNHYSRRPKESPSRSPPSSSYNHHEISLLSVPSQSRLDITPNNNSNTNNSSHSILKSWQQDSGNNNDRKKNNSNELEIEEGAGDSNNHNEDDILINDSTFSLQSFSQSPSSSMDFSSVIGQRFSEDTLIVNELDHCIQEVKERLKRKKESVNENNNQNQHQVMMTTRNPLTEIHCPPSDAPLTIVTTEEEQRPADSTKSPSQAAFNPSFPKDDQSPLSSSSSDDKKKKLLWIAVFQAIQTDWNNLVERVEKKVDGFSEKMNYLEERLESVKQLKMTKESHSSVEEIVQTELDDFESSFIHRKDEKDQEKDMFYLPSQELVVYESSGVSNELVLKVIESLFCNTYQHFYNLCLFSEQRRRRRTRFTTRSISD